MSLYVLAEAWDKSKAEGATLLILLALSDYSDDQGVCFPSEDTLAAKSRVSPRSVRRHLVTLKDLGEIETWEWFDKSRCKRNCYRIILGKLASFRGIPPREIEKKATILRLQIPTAMRRAVFERDGWRCCYCESHELLTIDHKIPVSAGGGGEIENLQTLCRDCNRRKSDQMELDLRPDSLAGRERPTVAGRERTASTGLDRPGVAAPARAVVQEPSKEPSIEPGIIAAIRDARVPSKVDRVTVTEQEATLAVAALEAWNRQTSQRLASKDWVSKIVMRIREHPELDAAAHGDVIERALANPWWKGHATPAVVYGNGALFERCLLALEQVPMIEKAPPRRYGYGVSARETIEEADRLEREETDR